uniref:Lysozyme g n=2 Tax=Oryzias latipes TaxID=8090 RepID=H2LA38_ORYLA
MLLIFCVGCFLVVQKRKLLSGLWRKMTALTAGSQRAATEEEEEHFTEYRNLEEMRTTGVSAVTATANNLTREGDLVLGVEGSEILAKKDLKPMSKYRNQIMNVGRKLRLHPALIAAMISKQSNAGQQLKPDGHGMHDANSYGLMQINRKFHAVKGEPFSEDHIDEGSTYLIHLIKTVTNWRPDWSREQHLKGALVCYMVGLEKEKLNYDGELDQQTPTRDFANDVIARAQFYAENGFRV